MLWVKRIMNRPWIIRIVWIMDCSLSQNDAMGIVGVIRISDIVGMIKMMETFGKKTPVHRTFRKIVGVFGMGDIVGIPLRSDPKGIRLVVRTCRAFGIVWIVLTHHVIYKI